MAGSAGGVRAGGAFVEIGAKDTALVSALKAAESKLKGFGTAVGAIGARIGGVGAAITAPFLGAAKVFADSGSTLALMSARTGASVEALSALGYAAAKSGTDLDAVEIGLKKMQKLLGAAALGSDEARVTLAQLGLNFRQLIRLNPDEQFKAVAKSLAAIQNPTLKTAAALSLFGKSGTTLLPLIDNMGALTQEAKDLGLVTDKDAAESALKLKDAFLVLERVTKKIVTTIGGAVAPIITDAVETFARLTKVVLDFAKANKPAFAATFKVGQAIAIAGAVVAGTGAAVWALGAAFGALAAVIRTTAVVCGAINAAFKVLTISINLSAIATKAYAGATAALQAIWAAALTPLGLITIGLAGLAIWLYKTGKGADLLAYLGDAFKMLKDDAVTAFGGISDALKAGDIRLAAQILWAVLKLEFSRGLQFLRGLWADWGVAVTTAFHDVSTYLASAWVETWAGIRTVMVNSVAFLQNSFSMLIAALTKGWINFGGFFAKVWERIKAQFTGRDLKKKIAEINAQTAAGTAVVDAGTATTVGGRDNARKAELARIEQDRLQEENALGDDRRNFAEQKRKAAADSLAAGAADVAAAQKEFQDLTAEAAKKAAAVKPLVTPKARAGGQEFDTEGLDSTLKAVERKVEVKGTFNATALRGLGAGDTMSDIAKEGKKTNEELQKLNLKAAQGRLVFTS